ncbi:hypothetical protein N5P37_009011 [Trichoderma harzianum]|nr:hypothetical protein N5P37_009011 [Trichoderma harzianum]
MCATRETEDRGARWTPAPHYSSAQFQSPPERRRSRQSSSPPNPPPRQPGADQEAGAYRIAWMVMNF